MWSFVDVPRSDTGLQGKSAVWLNGGGAIVGFVSKDAECDIFGGYLVF